MLVFADGSQLGTLGGGVVEAKVKQHAVASLTDGHREVICFPMEEAHTQQGLVSGGHMRLLIDPVRPGDDITYYRKLAETLASDAACTEAVVMEEGKSPDRFIFDSEGKLIASQTESVMPKSIADGLRDVNSRPRPYIVDGTSYLPHTQRYRLIIVGAGHVGQKVAELASDVGFRVWVADDRDDYCNHERFPNAEKLLAGPIETTAAQFALDNNTFCIIVTRGHNHDHAALREVVNQPARYIGMIGSKRKIMLIFDDLRQGGVSDKMLRRVHAPLGFDIGSQTVPEIAISIVAELIAHRNLEPGSFSKLTRKSLLAEEV